MENPEFFEGGYYNAAQFKPERLHSDTKSAGDHFIVEDLLEFPNDDAVAADYGFNSSTVTGTGTSTVTALDSCNSSFSSSEPHFLADVGCRGFADAQFSGDLCVPHDELAELEWLSNFVEESFSCEDLQKLQLISGIKARPNDTSETHEFQAEANQINPMYRPEVSVPGKARSKRSRATPCNWTSRLLVLSPSSTEGPDSTETDIKKTPKPKKKEGGDNNTTSTGGEGRKCLHCATDKTPQWRTGPMGPKTLCNACGVRYKSGRLVPEYRPAASPTFVLTKHSNSHRKVMELRRQKELKRAQQQQLIHQNLMFDHHISDGDDYLIHQAVGPDFRQMI
ncbi:LOW QUALITY PROTEIN: GATA transcription factor 12-like [Diospyros lotus]|uniref:LOW QUALITY PROTEIN: GATA transcription factor 12-like n=1 Tax=Diospyros lotus TaxID=55363 RepID=UPI002255A27B|nr:LOW QUALITY PROTEIN: GATA transcription factor 12-like [Diospyros lotus]